MPCDCEGLKRSRVNGEYNGKLAKQIIDLSASRECDFDDMVAQLTQWSNFDSVSLFKGEADDILKPLIKAVEDYDGPFNQKYLQEVELVDKVSQGDVAAIATFRMLMNDMSRKVSNIQGTAITAEDKLNTLRENTTREISRLAGQIEQSEADQIRFQTKIRLCNDAISALQRRLNDLNWAWLACIFPFFCLWLPALIQEVAFNKSQQEAELRRRISELNQANAQFNQLKQQHQRLVADYNASIASLVSTQAASGKCVFILNNVSGILDALQNIDPDSTAFILQRMLSVLKQNWDDLVSQMRLLAAALNIN